MERQARVGRKLAATGNGRCNLSNLHLEQGDYQTDSPAVLQIFHAFGVQKTLDFFHSLGLVTVSEASGDSTRFPIRQIAWWMYCDLRWTGPSASSDRLRGHWRPERRAVLLWKPPTRSGPQVV